MYESDTRCYSRKRRRNGKPTQANARNEIRKKKEDPAKMDDLRFPRTDAGMNGLVSPPRNSSRFPHSVSGHDHRTSLPRRFTTDSGRVPTLSNILLPRGPEQPQDYASVRRAPSPRSPTWFSSWSGYLLAVGRCAASSRCLGFRVFIVVSEPKANGYISLGIPQSSIGTSSARRGCVKWRQASRNPALVAP